GRDYTKWLERHARGLCCRELLFGDAERRRYRARRDVQAGRRVGHAQLPARVVEGILTMQNWGFAWIAGAFLICPCHLPLTLGLAATLLSGTAAGVALHAHPFVAGAIVSTAWAAAMWRGFHLLKSAESR